MSEQSQPKRFDLTVNLGHVIVTVCALSGIVGSHYVSDWRMAALERQATNIEVKLDRFAAALIEAAVQGQRIKDLERRLDIAEQRAR